MKNHAILAAVAIICASGGLYLLTPRPPAHPQPRFTQEQIETRKAQAEEKMEALDVDIELTNRRISAIRDELRMDGITAGRVALLSADLSEEMGDLERLGKQRSTAHRIFLRMSNAEHYPHIPSPLWAETDEIDPRSIE
jgi:DNA-binding IclR family transcriptional regulator